MSITAWATASVTTSASVTLRLALLRLQGRRSSAVANTAVSNRSRSASIVALPRVDGDNRAPPTSTCARILRLAEVPPGYRPSDSPVRALLSRLERRAISDGQDRPQPHPQRPGPRRRPRYRPH